MPVILINRKQNEKEDEPAGVYGEVNSREYLIKYINSARPKAQGKSSFIWQILFRLRFKE